LILETGRAALGDHFRTLADGRWGAGAACWRLERCRVRIPKRPPAAEGLVRPPRIRTRCRAGRRRPPRTRHKDRPRHL